MVTIRGRIFVCPWLRLGAGPGVEVEGRVLFMFIGRRFTLDIYVWRRFRLGLWRMAAVGIVGDARLGWVEVQVRERV